jgi:cysteine-rich repeat protein
MTSIKLSLRTGLPLVLLAACSFDGLGLGSEGGGDDTSTAAGTSTDADTTTTAPTTSTSTTDPSGSATEPEPGTTTDPTATSTTDPTTTTTATTDPSSTTDAPAVCGDSEVDPGEECDAGRMNGDDQACTAACLVNICGDGKQGPGEGCDDGNLTAGDGCSPQCAGEACGDGVVQPPEACDDDNDIDNDGCTNACTLPACGDKIVQAGEQCDTGGETAGCNSDCTTAVCGDGKPNAAAGELCDDGNLVNTDGCAACKPAKCGDGFVQANVETCDDGNMVDNDACSNTCKLGPLRVFVSSDTYNGNLGGLAGADQKCIALATAANLGGTWMAWLSDGVNGPATRFVTKGGQRRYARIDGKVVANTWADLIDGTLALPINVTEKNMTPPGSPEDVWTNTNENGTPNSANSHCQSWTSAAGNSGSNNGDRTFMDGKWTKESDDQCNDSNHIYCFEQ